MDEHGKEFEEEEVTELDVDLWLKPEEIVGDTELEFCRPAVRKNIPIGEGEETRTVFEIGVLLPGGAKRRWTMNVTSQRAVAQAYGTNPQEWFGKKTMVFLMKQNVRGKMKDVIYARIPEKVQEALAGKKGGGGLEGFEVAEEEVR